MFMVILNVHNASVRNIIFLIKHNLGSIEKHKQLVSKGLKEHCYDEETIKTWVEFIE